MRLSKPAAWPSRKVLHLARPHRIIVNALNVAFENKSLQNRREKYRELLVDLYELNKAVQVRGEERLLLGSVEPAPENGGNLFIGSIDRFTDIDAFAWYNRQRRRPASRKEREAIEIPPSMRANYKQFPILFDIASHRLVFLSKDGKLHLSARQVRLLISTLVERASVKAEYGNISVNIEQRPTAIENILSYDHIRKLSITLTRPNDTLGVLKAQFLNDLDHMRAGRADVIITADSSNRLKPNKDLRNLARSAASDGEVKARVLENGRTREVSSTDFPVEVSAQYSAKNEQISAFIRAAKRLLRMVARTLA
ncbi:MAG: hypothetical protein JWM87_1353 [Candidatus Eremiobacteraeota bacterium]|nr:hypothetical protein [Candidatus Eremiobacteraeota bacterium]